jgi:hypothetical protein
MAQRVTVTLEDDLDGGPADETVRFGFAGAEYEIDLSKDNAAAFREQIAPFIEDARKAGRGEPRRRARTVASRRRSGDIRAWAKEHGIGVGERGLPAGGVDLRNSTGSVRSLAASGADPGYRGSAPSPAGPEALKNEVDQFGSKQLPARDLIGLWGRRRRTAKSIELVSYGLVDLGLVVEPQLATVKLDDPVTISNAIDWRSESAWVADEPINLRVVWGAAQESPLYASDLVAALWNIELLYDFSLLLAHPAYQGFNLTDPNEFFTSGWRTLERQHRLEARSVEHHSPLLFLTVIPLAVAGAAGVWAITQTFEKVANFRLNREKLKAEVRKARAEASQAEADARRVEAEAESAEYQRQLDRRQATVTSDRIRAQIEALPMPIVEAELTGYRSAE